MYFLDKISNGLRNSSSDMWDIDPLRCSDVSHYMIKFCSFFLIKINKGMFPLVESSVMMKEKSLIFLDIDKMLTRLFYLILYINEMFIREWCCMISSYMEGRERVVHIFVKEK